MDKWLDYGVLETILLYWLGWDFCILAVIIKESGGCSAHDQVAAYSGLQWNLSTTDKLGIAMALCPL